MPSNDDRERRGSAHHHPFEDGLPSDVGAASARRDLCGRRHGDDYNRAVRPALLEGDFSDLSE